MNKTLVLYLLITICFLDAKSYENAEDSRSSRWQNVSSLAVGKVSNLYDKEKKSRVIKFNGDSTKSTYLLHLERKVHKDAILQWQMKYKEDFVIIIDCETNYGKRYFIYTVGETKSNLMFGLGRDSTNNHWQTYRRDLSNDLRDFEPKNTIIKIKNFVIKGSGLLDNIELNSREKTMEKSPLISLPKKNLKKISGKKMPKIRLKGRNPIHLKIGEEYLEPSAIAKDIDGSNISVNISHNIDIFKDGEYIVIYIATNKLGNTAVDKRHIIVGTLTKKKSPKLEKPEKNDTDSSEFTEDGMALDKRTKEILMWDRKVNLNEDKIKEVKEKVQRPLRPGL
jgi:hypothetical protein